MSLSTRVEGFIPALSTRVCRSMLESRGERAPLQHCLGLRACQVATGRGSSSTCTWRNLQLSWGQRSRAMKPRAWSSTGSHPRFWPRAPHLPEIRAQIVLLGYRLPQCNITDSDNVTNFRVVTSSLTRRIRASHSFAYCASPGPGRITDSSTTHELGEIQSTLH